MASLISLNPEQSSTSERVSEIFSTASALISGLALLLVVAVAF